MDTLRQLISWLANQVTTRVAQAQSQSSLDTPTEDVSFQTVIRNHLSEAFFWLVVVGTTILLIFLISITRIFEEWLDPLLFRIKRFAPYIMQATFGVGLILSAYFGGFLGPTLPLESVFGPHIEIVQSMFYVGGIMLLFGIYPRLVSFAVLLITIPLSLQYPSHFLQHAIYLGEAGTIFFLGSAYHASSAAAQNLSGITKEIRLHLHKYKFLILRIFLGTSIIAGAVYLQLLQPSKLPAAVTESQLVGYFPNLAFFLLIVVTVEVLLGLFIIIGFEIRFASIAYLAFLVFQVIFFQQAVWPHIILIGTPLAMLTHGYDKYTLGGRLFSRGNLEPIL